MSRVLLYKGIYLVGDELKYVLNNLKQQLSEQQDLITKMPYQLFIDKLHNIDLKPTALNDTDMNDVLSAMNIEFSCEYKLIYGMTSISLYDFEAFIDKAISEI